MEKEARHETNRCVAALRALWDGDFATIEVARREGWGSAWADATPSQRHVVTRILETHRKRRRLERARRR